MLNRLNKRSASNRSARTAFAESAWCRLFPGKSGNFPPRRLYNPVEINHCLSNGPGSPRVGVEDRELVRRVLAGHTDEFRVFVDRYQASVYRFTRALLRNREDADDMAQEVFLAAFANLSSYAGSRASFSTWLFTIARNRCINLLKRRQHAELDEPVEVEDVAASDVMESKELAQQLDRALDALPLEQRSAFVLAEIEELPYAEIARIERTTVGTVKSRIHRAKQRLRSLLETEMREFT